MAEANNSDIPALSFEKALQALEEIVSRLEAGKVDLQESITIYERGEALRKHCEDKLKEAVQYRIAVKTQGNASRITVLTKDGAAEMGPVGKNILNLLNDQLK